MTHTVQLVVFSAAGKGFNLTCFNHGFYLKVHVFPEKFSFVFAVYNGYTSQGMHLWYFLLHRGVSLCAVRYRSLSCILCLISFLRRISHEKKIVKKTIGKTFLQPPLYSV